MHSRWPPTLRKSGSWKSDCEKSSLVRSTDSELALAFAVFHCRFGALVVGTVPAFGLGDDLSVTRSHSINTKNNKRFG